MKRSACSLLLCAAVLAGAAAPPATAAPERRTVALEVSGDTVVVVKSFPCKVTAPAGHDLYFWSFPDAVKATQDDNVLTVTAAPRGESRVSVNMVTIDFVTDDKGKTKKVVTKESGEATLTVGDVPQPVPPTPPVPPAPPQPPAPIPAEGFRVLIVEDVKGRVKLPPAQSAILFDKKIRDFLQSKCVLGTDSKTREWRIWDAGVDASAESKLWQDALKRKHDSLPWIVISDGKTGFEGPLPADVDATLALLKKYAPASGREKK